jgi:hypothetical protein
MMDTFVQSGALRATINNVQLIELNTVRPLLPHTLDQVIFTQQLNQPKMLTNFC